MMLLEPLDELVEVAKRAVTWVLTPEAVCITAATLQPKEMHIKFGFDIVSEYFEKQRHSDLPSFAAMTVENKVRASIQPGNPSNNYTYIYKYM